ncbi:MAG: NADP-dependent isocitrate dehydrogenase, partial [Gammaproteobacteria bacterium]|nr:NADP-dependent isocitrate dehydrogenase [Gammaproteobacteria bacterium]
LRWDSLGEYLALAAALEHLANSSGNKKALILSKTLDQATGKFLDSNKSPSRKVNELDNRGSHFYLTLYWAQALAEQTEDKNLQERFTGLARTLGENEEKIVDELNAAQGRAVDLGGYYHADPEIVANAMRPSATLNAALNALG